MIKPDETCKGCVCARCQLSTRYGVLFTCGRCSECSNIRLTFCPRAVKSEEGPAFKW